MNALTELLKSPAAFDLGWALLHFLWQGALLAGLCSLAWHLLRHHSARSRYAVGCFFLFAMVSAPLSTYAMRAGRTVEPAPSRVVSPATIAAAKPQAELSVSRNPSGDEPTPWANSTRVWAWPSHAFLSWLVGSWFVGVFL